ncbi:hypothetical protein DW796_04520 [Collinsella sp. AM31-2AC]|nr:hypothetical protein DW796_04520 [Collinsella sp. AM31-2AC]
MRQRFAALAAFNCDSTLDFGNGRSGKEHVFHTVHHGSFTFVDLVIPVNDVPAVMSATVRHAALGVLVDSVSDTLAVDCAFPFGKYLEHAKVEHAR